MLVCRTTGMLIPPSSLMNTLLDIIVQYYAAQNCPEQLIDHPHMMYVSVVSVQKANLKHEHCHLPTGLELKTFLLQYIQIQKHV